MLSDTCSVETPLHHCSAISCAAHFCFASQTLQPSSTLAVAWYCTVYEVFFPALRFSETCRKPSHAHLGWQISLHLGWHRERRPRLACGDVPLRSGRHVAAAQCESLVCQEKIWSPGAHRGRICLWVRGPFSPLACFWNARWIICTGVRIYQAKQKEALGRILFLN